MTAADAIAKLAEFSLLKAGWDSYGSKEIDVYVIARAKVLLTQWQHINVLECSPMPNGGVVLVLEGAPCMTIWVEPFEEPP